MINNKDMYEQLLSSVKTKEGQSLKINPLGSLGLLALGDIGIMLWRYKRNQTNVDLKNQVVNG